MSYARDYRTERVDELLGAMAVAGRDRGRPRHAHGGQRGDLLPVHGTTDQPASAAFRFSTGRSARCGAKLMALHLARYVWAGPTTLLGLAFLPFQRLSGGGYQIVDGVLELYGGTCEVFLRRFTVLDGGASAMTLGHVVLGRDRFLLEATRAHERVHVRQCERWGPLFLPAYGFASLIALLRGGEAYLDNLFERQAYREAHLAGNHLEIMKDGRR